MNDIQKSNPALELDPPGFSRMPVGELDSDKHFGRTVILSPVEDQRLMCMLTSVTHREAEVSNEDGTVLMVGMSEIRSIGMATVSESTDMIYVSDAVLDENHDETVIAYGHHIERSVPLKDITVRDSGGLVLMHPEASENQVILMTRFEGVTARAGLVNGHPVKMYRIHTSVGSVVELSEDTLIHFYKPNVEFSDIVEDLAKEFYKEGVDLATPEEKAQLDELLSGDVDLSDDEAVSGEDA